MDLHGVIARVYELDISVFNFLSYNLIFWGFITLIALQFLNTPYGRYARSGYGFAVNAKFAWCVQELPAFFVPIVLAFVTNSPRLEYTPNKILLACYLLHYFQRSLVFPFLIKGGKPTPFIPFALAFVFCLCNGYLQAGYILEHADFGSKWMFNSRLYLGLLLFFTGMLVNIQSDHILRNLRKPGETGYRIPRGGMFEYVSGANFFGETLEWFGFAVANGTLPAYSFFLFTLFNIGPRACHHHKYYQEKFEDYPKNRKAFIPFVI